VTEVHRISAVTLIIKNMERSCNFYSQIPGFKLVYGGSSTDSFTTYQIGKCIPTVYLNLELSVAPTNSNHNEQSKNKTHFGRIIFHTKDVDKLYSYLRSNKCVANTISFQNEPMDAPWGERYFHICEPDGYELSFAKPIKKRKEKKTFRA
jgi:catechol 2,3-dioxygenase-like lactoylglutathione lyase family enzyme